MDPHQRCIFSTKKNGAGGGWTGGVGRAALGAMVVGLERELMREGRAAGVALLRATMPPVVNASEATTLEYGVPLGDAGPLGARGKGRPRPEAAVAVSVGGGGHKTLKKRR